PFARRRGTDSVRPATDTGTNLLPEPHLLTEKRHALSRGGSKAGEGTTPALDSRRTVAGLLLGGSGLQVPVATGGSPVVLVATTGGPPVATSKSDSIGEGRERGCGIRRDRPASKD